MPRLFITPREIDFINDISKEVTKDIVGHKIYYFPVSFDKSNVHKIYEESPEKIIEQTIEINCIVNWEPSDVTTSKFGQDSIKSIKVYIQSRDMIQKDIVIKDGDFFSFGADIFEITTARTFKNIYGQIEYSDGIEINGRQVRKDNFAINPPGPTDEKYGDDDAIQDSFYQQRGFDENKEGPTGDKRDLIDKGILEAPDIVAPAETSGRGTKRNIGNAFYGEGDEENAEN